MFSNTIKKLGFVALAAGLLASYSSAALVSSSKIASKKDCEDAFCEFGRIGVGGAYYGVQANGVDIGGYAGYVSLGVKEVMKGRVQVGIDGFVGGGKSELKGSTLANLSTNPNLLIYGFGARVGVNVLTKSAPLFVSLTVDVDGYNANPRNSNGFYRSLGLAGVALDGEIPTSSKTRILYGASYSWIFGATYKFGDSAKVNVSRSIDNYAVSANIGFEYEISKGISTYLKLIGKYQNISTPPSATVNSAAINYPSSNNFAGMLEVGLGF